MSDGVVIQRVVPTPRSPGQTARVVGTPSGVALQLVFIQSKEMTRSALQLSSTGCNGRHHLFRPDNVDVGVASPRQRVLQHAQFSTHAAIDTVVIEELP